MAFPAIQTSDTQTYNGNNAYDHILNLATNISAGDLLIMIFATDGDNTVSNWDGFTEIFSEDNSTGASLHIGYKIASGSEGATITVTVSVFEAAASICYRITGDDSGSNPPEVSTVATGNSANPDPASLTPTGGAKDYLWIACEGNDRNYYATAWPSSYSIDQQSEYFDGAAGCNVGAAARELNASSENPGTFTISTSEQWIACVVAIHPEAAEGTTYYQNTGQGAIAPVGILSKKTSKFMGEHSMSIAGILSKKTTPITAMGGYSVNIAGILNKKTTPITAMGGHAISITGLLTKAVVFTQNTGGHAMTITGTLTTVATFIRAVGSYAMTIIGTLVKKTSKGVGSGQIVSTGILSKKTSKDVGSGSVNSIGVLTKAIVVGQVVGGHAMTITSVLTTVVTFIKAVGGHAMTIIGTLVKKTSKSMGAGQVSSTGILSKKTSKNVGGGSVTSIGTLAIAIMYTQAVGGASVSIIGSLATQFIAGVEGVAKFIRRRKTFYKQ